MIRMDKKKSVLIQVVVVLAIIGIAIGAYTMIAKKVVPRNDGQIEQAVTTSTPTPSAPVITRSATSTVKKVSDISQPTAWKTYTSEKYGFAFQYPALSTVTLASSSSSVATTVSVKLQDSNIAYLGNGKFIKFQVYDKDSFVQYSEASQCKSFARTSLTIDGKTMDIVEHDKCKGEEGIISSTHYTHAIIPLSDTQDIVFTASLGSLPFEKNDFVNVILKTFKFIPRT